MPRLCADSISLLQDLKIMQSKLNQLIERYLSLEASEDGSKDEKNKLLNSIYELRKEILATDILIEYKENKKIELLLDQDLDELKYEDSLVILAKILEKTQEEEPLSKKELEYLYQIRSRTSGPMRDEPRRMNIIRRARNNLINDISEATGLQQNEIGTELRQIISDWHDGVTSIRLFYGGLNFLNFLFPSNVALPEVVVGDVIIDRISSFDHFVLPRILRGNLYLSNLDSAKTIVFPKEINGNLDLHNLRATEGLILPDILGGRLDLSGLRSAQELILPRVVLNDILLNSLKSFERIVLPEIFSGTIIIGVESADGLVFPQEPKEGHYLGIVMERLKTAKGVTFPKKMGRLVLSDLETIDGLVLPDELTEVRFMMLSKEEVEKLRKKYPNHNIIRE